MRTGLLLLLLLLLLLGSTAGQTDPVDQNALIALWNGFTSKGTLSWNTAASLCGQTGVACTSTKVTQLYISSKGVQGTIATEIGTMTSLTRLSLHSNSLRGTIPTQIASMTSLENLWLYSNSLSGSIPTQIGSLTKLTWLWLYSNSLSGNIPTQIGSLSKLTWLGLYSNSLSGSIPTQIGSLTKLIRLQLFVNSLSGSIPTQIGTMTSLRDLQLFGNSLSGSIPTQIGSLTSLQVLQLFGNSLSGSIPTQIGSLTKLIYLWLDSNSLSGTIPTEIGSLTSLSRLELSNNSLSGSIPTEIGSLTSLDWLQLLGNSLSGSIPTEIGSMASLHWLYFYSNSLSGTIPTEIGSMTSLAGLYLDSNNLSGSIPTHIGSMTRLQELSLYSNSLSGSIPTEIGTMTSLKQLYLQDNHLFGSIPSELGARQIQKMYLRGTNHLCPLTDYSSWAWGTDSPSDLTCTACGASFPLCQNGGTCLGGVNETFTCGSSACPSGTFLHATFPGAPVGTTVQGICLAGYEGTASALCLPSGQLQSLSDCSPLPLICPAQQYGAADFPETLVMANVSGACLPGWIGSPLRDCTADGWSPNVRNICERLTCASTTNADAETSTLVFGTCVAGFSGTPRRFCVPQGTTASFQAISSPCVADCAGDSDYAYASWPATNAGGIANGTCLAGYQGSPSRRCTPMGTWETNVQNVCRPIRCEPTSEGDADWPLTNTGTVTYGTCASGFKGRPLRSCGEGGTFGPIQSPCVPAGQCLPVPNYASASFGNAEAGQTATGTCLAGYEGSITRACTAAGWSATVTGRCTRKVCPPSNEGGFSFKAMLSNTRAYGTCVLGTGRPWRTCDENGSPGPVQGTCA